MRNVTKNRLSNRGGRPSREEAGKLRDTILDAATGLFFSAGYGATSVEAIAARAGISKRTFYHRFENKAAVFRVVVERVVDRLKPRESEYLFDDNNIEVTLQRLASAMLRASLTPESLALSRLIFAESPRFPELAAMATAQGARQKAVQRIAALLQSEIGAGRFEIADRKFAAEQFIQMAISFPQNRALALGQTMTPMEIDKWARATTQLFVNGCKKK